MQFGIKPAVVQFVLLLTSADLSQTAQEKIWLGESEGASFQVLHHIKIL